MDQVLTTGEKQMRVGDYIKTWHDTVAFGVEPFYSRILKINRVTIKVKTENGDSKLISKEFAEQHLVGSDEWHLEIEGRELNT